LFPAIGHKVIGELLQAFLKRFPWILLGKKNDGIPDFLDEQIFILHLVLFRQPDRLAVSTGKNF